ncbi:MAG: bifunctional riboflavin kinase/FAD synthetase [Proteobacteria bacterium]|nr:bifunctional riboflavin kinase/FAD synthetase [Pseudomonadota bacterium]MBU1611279.1 bifunctional riboflavin kinase/FAD synthetase [Pseudomonadota bacterium]
MIVAQSLDEIAGSIAGACVTIGNFDGVHLGHQRLIGLACSRAKAQDLVSVVLTFDPHPLRVLVGPETPPFITMTAQKLELIAGLGPNVALVLPFTRKLAALSPREFVKQFLVDGLAVKELVIGYDYHMGKGRSGNFETLTSLGQELGFKVDRVDPVTEDGAIVSSTRIRDMVQSGRVWSARPLLSRFYQVTGTVVHGMDRGGKLLGFPTANLKLVDELVPKHGVYAVWVEVQGQTVPGVANIGHNPTFGNKAVSVEAHLLDFDLDIYDATIRIHFVQRIRDERKFDGLDALVARIKLDIGLARDILAMPEAQPVLTAPMTLNGARA